MRFNCGLSKDENLDEKMKWHKWFAWYPVRVARNDCRWLETVHRKGTMFYYSQKRKYWEWQYISKEEFR